MTFRPLSALVAAALAAGVAPAQAPAPKTTETVVKLTVRPQAAPQPILRYVLLPELSEMQPGNAQYGYLRTYYPEQTNFHRPENQARREKWLAMPLDELAKDPQAVSQTRNRFFYRLMEAARLDRCDWDLLPRLRADGLEYLLPDVQAMRGLAAWLAVKARVEVAQNDFPEAIETLKTIFQLARHLSEHPTLVAHKASVAVATRGLDCLEELLQRPGAPNLYWPLTDLPNPLLDLRPALTGERMLVPGDGPGRPADPTQPLNPDQLRQWVERLRKHSVTSETAPDVGVTLAARAGEEKAVAAARQALAAAGLASKERLARLPPLQVVLLDEARRYEALRDELLAWAALPFHQGWPGLQQVGERTSGSGPGLPAVQVGVVNRVRSVYVFQAQLGRRLAVLRAVEAVRMYAAAHDGQPPDSLAAVSVPLADDPVTGRPLVYRREGQTFTLSGPPPAGRENDPASNVRYVVTIAK